MLSPIDSLADCLSSDSLAVIMFAEILTERLALRDLTGNDAQRIFEYRSRPEVSRFQSWGTESAEAIRLYIRGLCETEPGRPGSWYQIGIVLPACGELIGDCGFQYSKPSPVTPRLGLRWPRSSRGEVMRTKLYELCCGTSWLDSRKIGYSDR